MPYIPRKDRDRLENIPKECICHTSPNTLAIVGEQCDSPGELNYAICRLITGYMGLNVGSKPNYESWNEVLGVLSAVKLELYNRFIATYELLKKEANGDVFFDEDWY